MSDEQHTRRRRPTRSAFDVLPSLDPTLVGWHPSPKDQAVLDTVLPRPPPHIQGDSTLFGAAELEDHAPPHALFAAALSQPSASAHSAATAGERTRSALTQLPMHWLKTMRTCMLPAIVGTVPILMAGLHAKRMVADLPDVTATYQEMELLSEVRSGTSLAFEATKSSFSYISGTAFYACLLYSLVARRVVWPSIRLVYPLCMLCLIAVGQLYIFTPAAAGSTFLWNYYLPINFIFVYIMIVIPVRSIGRRVGDSTLWWKFFLWYVTDTLVTAGAFLYILENVPFMSDAKKAVYVIFIIPVLFEFQLTIQRLVVRSFSEHHESASWVMLSGGLIAKSIVSRFLVSTMQSSAFTFLGALHLPLVSEDWRDRQLYLLIGWCFGTDYPTRADDTSKSRTSSVGALSPDGKFQDPTKFWRNIPLRERYVQAEMVFSVTFMFLIGFFIWWLDISIDSVNPPDVADILTSILLQLIGVSIAHLGDVLYTEVVMRRPMILVVHHNFREYDLYLVFATLFYCAGTASLVLPTTLGRVPHANSTGTHEPTWLFLTEDVVSTLNTSAICAEFPSATAFAQYMGCASAEA